jgi:hypothetical protein
MLIGLVAPATGAALARHPDRLPAADCGSRADRLFTDDAAHRVDPAHGRCGGSRSNRLAADHATGRQYGPPAHACRLPTDAGCPRTGSVSGRTAGSGRITGNESRAWANQANER